MPDFVFPFLPIFPGGSPSDGPRYPGIQPLIDELYERARQRAEQPAPPSPDQPPPPESLPAPIVQPLPSPAEAAASGIPPQLTPFQGSFPGQYRGESGRLAKAFDEAYGIPLNMRRARRMARRKRTMRAQQPGETLPPFKFDPKPVPNAAPPATRSETRAEELRRRKVLEQDLKKIPTVPPPRPEPTPRGPPPRRARGGRGGIGAAVIIGGMEEGSGVVGGAIGNVIGGALYGRTAEEEAEAKRIEDELKRRQREEAVPLPGEGAGAGGVLTPFPVGRDPGGIPGIPQPIDAQGNPVLVPGRLGKMPGMPKAPAAPPTPRKQRGARALSAIQRMTRNPYAIAGILGLSLLGGKKKKQPSQVAPGAAIATPPLPTLSPGATPFPSMPGSYSIAGPSTSTGSSSCSCKPKRRGPKRRCLERGTVAWRSGRYKGKNAGTKCVRWE